MAMRRFVGINLGREPASRLFDELQRHLAVATVTIVDATIINAPTSTKNADKARDPPCIHPNAAPKRPNYPRSLADEEIDMPSTYAPAPYSDDP
jgi:hypothetical protein